MPIFIPRCYCKEEEGNSILSIQLHGFSDASEKAYGASRYLRFIRRSGSPVVTSAKSRLAPSKNKQTIPRLELLGNLLLTKLMGSVREALDGEIGIIIPWLGVRGYSFLEIKSF